MASSGVFLFEIPVTWSLTYRVWFLTSIDELSLKVTFIVPVNDPAVLVFLLSPTNVVVASSKSFLTSVALVSSLALTPSFQLRSSSTHFLILAGSRPPSSVTWSALDFFIVSTDAASFLSELSVYSPLSFTDAFTSVLCLILLFSILILPVDGSILANSEPCVSDQLLLTISCVATIVFVCPSVSV